MKVLVRITCLAGLVVGLAGLPALAAQSQQPSQKPQSGQPQQPQPNQQPQPGQQPGAQEPGKAAPAPPAPPPKTPAEEKAYKVFFGLPPTDPQAVITSGNDFLKKFPDSHYTGSIYAKLTNAYRELGDDAKMFESGQKALEANPNNVDVLAILAYSIPRRIDPNDLESNQKLQQAEGYAKRAIELIPTMPKPANLTDDQFTTAKNAELASCHSGLGLVYYYQHNLPSMITELEQAVKLDPTPDPTDQFLLGFAYQQAGRYTEAVAPLEACAATTGPGAGRFKSVLAAAQEHCPAAPRN